MKGLCLTGTLPVDTAHGELRVGRINLGIFLIGTSVPSTDETHFSVL